MIRNALDQYRGSGSREAELKLNMLLCSFVNQSILSVKAMFDKHHDGWNLVCDPYNPIVMNGISMRFVTDYREASAADVQVVHERVLKELAGQGRVMECKVQGVHCRTLMCVVECLTMWVACSIDDGECKWFNCFTLIDDIVEDQGVNDVVEGDKEVLMSAFEQDCRQLGIVKQQGKNMLSPLQSIHSHQLKC